MERPYKAAVPCDEVASCTIKPGAAGLGRPNNSIILPTKAKNGWKNISAQTTPNRLNTVCDKAARLAEVLATEAAILAVMVVPIFSPKTIAHAILNGIHPMLSMMRVMAIVAEEDWSMSVSTVPTPRKMSTDQKP